MVGKTNQQTKLYDYIVIGSGLAGSAAALTLALTGKKVGLVEAGALGGSATNTTDLPLSIIRSAVNRYYEAHHTKLPGLRQDGISLNYANLMGQVQKTISQNPVTQTSFYTDQGIDLISGRAHFISPDQIMVKQQTYQAEKFLIATGANWGALRIQGLDRVRYLTPDTAFKLSRPPKSLFIVGGDKVGVELAEIFASLGTEVFITELSTRLLPQFDKEVGQHAETTLSNDYQVAVATSSRVLSIGSDPMGKIVKFSHAGVERNVRVDQVLVAVDQQPNTDLGLENALVDYNSDGIITNRQLQTSNYRIYAAGDILGLEEQTFNASLEAEIASYNMSHTRQKTIDYRGVPLTIDLATPIASLGLSEDDCIKQNINSKSRIATAAEAPINNIYPQASGFIKLTVNDRRQIIGATLACPEAKSLAGELGLAIAKRMTVSDLRATSRPILSWSELISICLSKF